MDNCNSNIETSRASAGIFPKKIPDPDPGGAASHGRPWKQVTQNGRAGVLGVSGRQPPRSGSGYKYIYINYVCE